MKIEVRANEGAREILQLLIDDEHWRDLHTSVFGRRPSFPSCDTFAQFKEAFASAEYKAAKNFALKKLSIKSYPSTELRRKLAERLISKATIERVIQDLQQWGYLNDAEWMENFLRISSKKAGPRLLAHKLHAKGLPQETISSALNTLNDQEQKTQLVQLLKTRYRSKNLSDFKERQKVIGSLARKGFDINIIKESIYLIVNSHD